MKNILNKIKPIEIKYIRNVIPNLLLNKLELLKINNIGGILNTTVEYFESFKGTGVKAVRMFKDLKKNIITNPAKFYRIYEKNKEPDLPVYFNDNVNLIQNFNKIKPVEIKYIRNVIPNLLLNKLGLLKINDINGILNTTVEYFESVKGTSAKAVRMFRELKRDIITHPAKFYGIYKKNKESNLPNYFNDKANLIQNFKQFITEYEKLFKKKRNIDILFKKFGIGNDILTLEAIGTYHGITRERVRQIKESEIKNIKNLLTGNSNLKLNCKCRKEFLGQISNFLLFTDNRSIISLNEINTFFKKTYKYEIKKSNFNYLALLLNIFGYDHFYYLDNSLFYKSDKFSNEALKQFQQFLITIQKILEANIFPLSPATVAFRVKKILKNPSILSSDVTNALEQITEFEKVIDNNNKYYQLRLDLLSSGGDKGIRVLKENNQNMHFRDLTKLTNQKLLKYRPNKLITSDNLKAHLITSPLTVPIGNTGYWTLKEWESAPDRVLSLIRNALASRKAPMTINEIYNHISKKRRKIKKESIEKIIPLKMNGIIKLVNKKYILQAWSYNYRKKKLIPNK